MATRLTKTIGTVTIFAARVDEGVKLDLLDKFGYRSKKVVPQAVFDDIPFAELVADHIRASQAWSRRN